MIILQLGCYCTIWMLSMLLPCINRLLVKCLKEKIFWLDLNDLIIPWSSNWVLDVVFGDRKKAQCLWIQKICDGEGIFK